MDKYYSVIYETNEFKIVEANHEDYIKISAEICAKEFANCFFFAGLGATEEDIYKIAFEASKYSLKDHLLILVIDKNDDKVVTTSVGLSHLGRMEFEERLSKIDLSFDLEMYKDLASRVEIPEKEGPESAYLFLIATVSGYRNKSLGSCLVSNVLQDLKNKKFKVAYGGTVNEKAEYIVKKNGAKLYKTIYYEDFEYNNKKLKIFKKGEKQTSFAFDLD